jgi:hypothetical protein
MLLAAVASRAVDSDIRSITVGKDNLANCAIVSPGVLSVMAMFQLSAHESLQPI